MADFIAKELYNEKTHEGWKKFRDLYFKNKKALVEWLAAQRKYPDAPTSETHPELFEKDYSVKSYQGNPSIKASFQGMEYTPAQLKEYKRCMEDPLYFAETYIRIMSVDFGEIPFTLYEFQRGMVQDFKDNRFNICKLPRQCGKSTTSVAFILWYILFHPGKTVGILANKGELAQELLGRLALAYEQLPFWLQQGVETWNKRSIELENGSKVIATSSSGSAARGMSFSLLFLDEFAFVEPHQAEDFFRSVYPTISSGADTKMVVVSTPKGMNHFYKMWTEAEQGRSAFKPIEINWWDIPGRDEEWKEQQIANTSEDQFRQEFMCQFIGSANTLIAPEKLSEMSYVDPIKSHEGVDYYEQVKPGHKYIICVDTARGVRLDYSAFVCVDITNVPYKVVAKFRANDISPMVWPHFVTNIARYFNNAMLLVEANDMGENVANTIAFELEYENILRTAQRGRAGYQLCGGSAQNSKVGVTTSTSVKNKGCSGLKSIIEAKKLVTEDYEIYVELTTFTRKGDGAGSGFEAEPGCNDDLVMCLVLFGWAIGSEAWKELTDTNADKLMYKDRMGEEEDGEDMPIGFLNYDDMFQTVDHQGDVWQPVDFDQQEKPDWYDDVYQNFDPRFSRM